MSCFILCYNFIYMLKNLLFLRLPILFLLLLISFIIIFFINQISPNDNLDSEILPKLLTAIFTTALLILTYIWSTKLLNGWWTLLPPFLFTFSLASINGINTVQIATALFYFLALYTLINFIFKPSRTNLLLAGMSFGLTQLIGLPALILIPYFLILISVFYIASVKRDWQKTAPADKFKRFGIRALRYFRSIIVMFIIGFLFAFFIKFAALGTECNDFSCYHYSYLSFKIYWPFLITIATAFIYSLINVIKSFRISKFKGFWDYLGTSFPEFSMIVFIAMYSLFILFFSPGLSAEKLIPILPMVYILTASGLKKMVNNYL